MSETEAEVLEHNRSMAWKDIENHLRIAYESVEHAQGELEELGEEDYADQLDAVQDGLLGALRERGVEIT